MAFPVVLKLSEADPLAAEMQLPTVSGTVSVCQLLTVVLFFL